MGKTRTVPVELIVKGESVEQQQIAADGSVHDITFEYRLARSCWLAVRIFPAAHTDPIFVEVMATRSVRAAAARNGASSR